MLDSGCIFLSKAVLVTELMQPIVEETEIEHRIAHPFHNSKHTMREGTVLGALGTCDRGPNLEIGGRDFDI